MAGLVCPIRAVLRYIRRLPVSAFAFWPLRGRQTLKNVNRLSNNCKGKNEEKKDFFCFPDEMATIYIAGAAIPYFLSRIQVAVPIFLGIAIDCIVQVTQMGKK